MVLLQHHKVPLQLTFAKPDRVYSLGDVLDVNCSFELKHPFNLTTLHFRLECFEETTVYSGDQCVRDRALTRLISDYLFDYPLGRSFVAGSYSFPISFVLDPSDPRWASNPKRKTKPFSSSNILSLFPPSQELACATISWGLSCFLCAFPDRPEEDQPKKVGYIQTKITLKESNWNLTLPAPISLQTEDHFQDFLHQFSFLSGALNFQCSLDKEFYFAGEDIRLLMKFQNNSTERVQQATFKFREIIEYWAADCQSFHKETLSKHKVKLNSGLEAQHQGKVGQLRVHVPQTCISIDGSLFQKSYILELVWHNGSVLSRDYKITLPILVLAPNLQGSIQPVPDLSSIQPPALPSSSPRADPLGKSVSQPSSPRSPPYGGENLTRSRSSDFTPNEPQPGPTLSTSRSFLRFSLPSLFSLSHKNP